MTITGQSALSKDDIAQMVRDAEAHAEEDRQRKEEAEARNQADTMVYQTERMIREDESDAKRLTADEKERLTEAIKHLKDSLKGFDLAKVKADTEALALVTQTVSARLYSEATAASNDGAGAPGGGGPGGAGAGASNDDEVVDAEIVDEAR